MKIVFTEPTAPRYIYINPQTNKIHLMMPIISGSDIGLDNTCKSVFALQEFFGKSQNMNQRAVLDELGVYQKALEFDISLIDGGSELKAQKQARLDQINEYKMAIDDMLMSPVLAGLSAGLPHYPKPLQRIIGAEDSNLYSMILRPQIMDNFLRTHNPVFSLERTDVSLFQKMLTDVYHGVGPLYGKREQVIASVLASNAGKRNDFVGVQRILTYTVHQLLDVTVDFTKTAQGIPVTKAIIDDGMAPETAKETIEALLGYCAPNLFDAPNESPVRRVKNPEELSIITQFFLGIVNIYCRSKNISLSNFGAILDSSHFISNQVLACVLNSILTCSSVEKNLLKLVNNHRREFGLTRRLFPADIRLIKQLFITYYAQIKEAPHFDEFIILDDTKVLPFFSHQGAICINFAKFAQEGFPELKSAFFKEVYDDFIALTKKANFIIPPNNPWIYADTELSINELLDHINDETQFKSLLNKLPKERQDELLASPIPQQLILRQLLHAVARGEQNIAEHLLLIDREYHLLLLTGRFTDYSGRTFNCTAYEYAYWAKDTHMCRMLEQFMDEETSAQMLARCEAMERDGLEYRQHGEYKNSKHFDFTPLITALRIYCDGYNYWIDNEQMAKLSKAWLNIGKAQCDVPAYVAHEYTRTDRSFNPTPDFDDDLLPRNDIYYNYLTERDERWFSSVNSGTEGLGIHFSIYRMGCDMVGIIGREGVRVTRGEAFRWDLEAICRLDEESSDALIQSRRNLKYYGDERSHCCTIS